MIEFLLAGLVTYITLNVFIGEHFEMLFFALVFLFLQCIQMRVENKIIRCTFFSPLFFLVLPFRPV